MSENFSYNNKIEQLQKLYRMSVQYADKFGYLKFLKTAILTLKHEGFSVFTPELKKTQVFDELFKSDNFSDYTTWLNKQKYFKNNSKLDYDKNLAIVIDLDENKYEKQKVENNIRILLAYPCIKKIFLINSRQNDFEILDERIKLLEKSNFPEWSSLNVDFVIFQKPNVVFNTDGILELFDYLEQNPDFDLLYSDEDRLISEERSTPFFKPDWSPFLLLHLDYVSNFFVIPKTKLEINNFKNYFDLVLKITDTKTKVHHLPYPVVCIYEATKNVKEHENILNDALHRRNISAKILPGHLPQTYNLSFNLTNKPKVSIIIPTKDHKKILERCINSIEGKTNYKNFEIIISDNNSTKKETHDYYASLNYKIITSKELFNFSKVNNKAVKESSGDLLLFLNDDVAVLKNDWLDNLVGIILQQNIGAVCPKLIFSDNTIQFAGMALLKTGSGFHPFLKYPSFDPGYFGMANVSRECSAVTAACLLTRKSIFDEIDGFDETLDLYYGDTDLCFKIRHLGYSVIYDANMVLLHEGSSKTKEFSDSFFAIENHYDFVQKWPNVKKGDPYYNVNLDWNYSLNMD